MAGTKNALKALPKSVASDGQQSLLHFYKKRSKPSKPAAPEDGAVETVPLGLNGASDLPALPPTGEMSTSLRSSVEAHSEQDIADGSSRAPRTTHSGQSEPIADVQEDSSGNQILPHFREVSEPGLDTLQQPVVVDRSASPSRVGASDTPLPKEVYPIFKRHVPHPSSPLSSTAMAKRPPNQIASSSKMPLLEPRRRTPEVNTSVTHVDLHDVIDLSESPHRGGSTTSPHTTAAARSRPILIIDDELDICGSQDAPIDITSSPSPKLQQSKVVHPFFARRVMREKVVDDIGTSRPTTSAQMQTPWPNAEMQHSRGPQSCFWSSAPSPFPMYRGPPPPPWFSSQPNIKFLENDSEMWSFPPEIQRYPPESHTPTPLEREEIISRMPYSHRKHSAISRLLDVEPESPLAADNAEAWTYKWRPRSTAEILGNEDNVRYMKEWLHALEIRTGQTLDEKPDMNGKSTTETRGAKRPVVMRAVEKKHGRKRRRIDSDEESSLEDWIVKEEEDEDEDEGEEDDSANEGHPEGRPLPGHFSLPNHRVSVSPSNSPVVNEAEDGGSPHGHCVTQFVHLTNTILLVGPSGSGKTSSVYACAEELGWEVFEVYPGIGRRSGANISSLVGDVGKNHLVGRRGTNRSAKGASVQPLIKSGFGFLTEEDHGNDTAHEEGNSAVRQSIILFEEVDILFKEDANFWPAVVNIIKTSHRPVFMTCNDLSLVPRDDLPLQATLLFRPCSAPLATSFLQSVCLAEGRAISQQHLDAMYTKTYQLIVADQPDEPQVPFPSQPQACPDLRHVLNELQFWCQRAVSTGDDEDAATKKAAALDETSLMAAGPFSEAFADERRSADLSDGNSRDERTSPGYEILLMWKHCEDASYVDGYLERRSGAVLDALAIDRYEPSGDDEMGHTLLEKPRVTDYMSGLAFYSRDEVIAREALGQSRHVFGTSGVGPRARSRLLGNEHGATPESRSLQRDRATNQEQVASYLDDVIPLSAPLLPRPPAVLDYAAYVRQMVAVDDAGAGAGAAGRSTRRGGRETRSRGQGGEPRRLALSARGLAGARATRVGDGAGDASS